MDFHKGLLPIPGLDDCVGRSLAAVRDRNTLRLAGSKYLICRLCEEFNSLCTGNCAFK